MKKLILLLIIPLFFFMPLVAANMVVPDRPLNGIYDPNGYLTTSVAETLESMNAGSETQVGIYIVDTLDDSSIEEVANEVARKWKIGKQDSNSGILIAIAIKDRKFRIETSNEAAIWLTDSKARSLLNDSKPYMKEGKYTDALNRILVGISKAESGKAEIINKKENKNSWLPKIDKKLLKNNEGLSKYFDYIPFPILFYLIFFLLLSLVTWFRYLKRCRFSKYEYEGKGKLYPDFPDFVPNDTWTEERKSYYKKNKRLIRSQYNYAGYNKLYPDSKGFLPNDTWTTLLIEAYYAEVKRKQLDRLNRSQYSYNGKGKLYPNDKDFVKNASWTSELKKNYYASQRVQSSSYGRLDSSTSRYDTGSSSSSWSSDDWDGGGFDGGGSSDSW